MIANKSRDKASAWEAWGKDCDFKIESHAFGYDPRYDPKAGKPAAKKRPAPARRALRIHVVKSGDSLWGIARDNGTTVAEIMRNNGLRTARIRPGMTRKV